jgi:hypothetical protein
MNALVVYGQEIPFDDHGRYNLNDFWRVSGAGEDKRPSQWLENDDTKDFIKTLKEHHGNFHDDVVTKVHGGNNSGVFTDNELVAIKYAAWINKPFEIEVYKAFLEKAREKYNDPGDHLDIAQHLIDEQRKQRCEQRKQRGNITDLQKWKENKDKSDKETDFIARQAYERAFRTAKELAQYKRDRQKRAMHRIPDWMTTWLLNITGGCCMKCGRQCRWDVDENHDLYGHKDHIERPHDGYIVDLRKLQLLCQEDHKIKTRLERRGIPWRELDFRSEAVKRSAEIRVKAHKKNQKRHASNEPDLPNLLDNCASPDVLEI